ncbi:MAG: NUDIX domain-containing protein [Actinophytocola sp.]|nr:NUDIX domain-containing protein [Actinophytocola sp.]
MAQPTAGGYQPPVAAAIIVKDGQVLLVRRRVPEGSLSWQFPAGKVEDGEDPTDAAVRETREETGLVVAARQVLGERSHPATDRRMIYVACDVVAGEATVADKEEIADVTWSDSTQLSGYIPHPLYGPVLNYLDARLKP